MSTPTPQKRPLTAAGMVAAATAQVESIPPAAAAAEIAAGDVVVLDVREPVEWEDHIGGAVQVPRGLLEFVADPASARHNPALDPSRRVIVYCRSGSRSALAGRTLQDLGYRDVANLAGGLTAWASAGLPIASHHQGI
jgi:rhodanese-related sulfurtransferase